VKKYTSTDRDYGGCYNRVVDNIEMIEVDGPGIAGKVVADRLNQLSKKNRLLWLVPGGSAAEVAASACHYIAERENIIISLTDERFGPVGHTDSNWRRLKDLGFKFSPKDYEILSDRSLTKTTTAFNAFLDKQINGNAFKTALLGMGEDGHISGILPGSPAISSAKWAVSYSGPDFIRLTTTAAFISRVDEAFIYIAGSAKRQQIDRLARNIDRSEQPAQLLKQLPRVVFYYSN
jgi:6-phosphogluconolactonase/glucosamine-6-phosphate isomerase/deaminase